MAERDDKGKFSTKTEKRSMQPRITKREYILIRHLRSNSELFESTYKQFKLDVESIVFNEDLNINITQTDLFKKCNNCKHFVIDHLSFNYHKVEHCKVKRCGCHNLEFNTEKKGENQNDQ